MPRRRRFVHVLLAGAALSGAASAAGDPLASYRWQARVLLVTAPAATDARLVEQKRIYAAARRGMTDRDLVMVEAIGQSAESLSTRRRYRIREGEFAAILFGKDGGEKLRSANPLQASQLFETVDQMPMRRDEMRRRPAG